VTGSVEFDQIVFHQMSKTHADAWKE